MGPRGQVRRSARVRIVRLGLAALVACAACGCLTPKVLERARSTTEAEIRESTIGGVKSAIRLDSGALLLCLEIEGFESKDRSVVIPVQALGEPRKRTGFDFGREKGFDGPSPDKPSTLRYVFVQDDLEDGCPDLEPSLKIFTMKRANAPRLLGSRGTGIYILRPSEGFELHYWSEKPLWSNLRDLEIAPVLDNDKREYTIPGKPAYYALLPFALVADVALSAFLFIGLAF